MYLALLGNGPAGMYKYFESLLCGTAGPQYFIHL